MRGSIKKQTGKRGTRWVATIDLGRDPTTGRRRQQRKTFPTRREAEDHVAKTRHELRTGTYIEPSTTPLADFLRQWLETITVRPATADRYRRIVEGRVVPDLGAVQLGKLTPMQVQDWYAKLLASGLSPTTVALYHGLLHRALDQAVKWQMVFRNVCDAVDAPRPQNPEMQTWSAEQVRAFLAGSRDDDLAALWRLAVVTGMRRGELLALRWGDVNFTGGTLSVRRTLSRGEDGIVFGEPKTAAGKRTIDLDGLTIDLLRSHRAEQAELRLQLGPAWTDNDLVFERGAGEPLHPNVLGSRFRSLVKRCGLQPIRFHDLRHTAATLMLANGEHPKVVQERLGHADISMTLNLYSHVMPGMQRQASDRLAALLEA